MYCNICNKYKKLKKKQLNTIYFLKDFLLFTVSVEMNIEKIFKEEESIEILTFLGLIDNIEEYLKIYNYVWRKLKSKI